jgi:hypothetical protein
VLVNAIATQLQACENLPPGRHFEQLDSDHCGQHICAIAKRTRIQLTAPVEQKQLSRRTNMQFLPLFKEISKIQAEGDSDKGGGLVTRISERGMNVPASSGVRIFNGAVAIVSI